MDWLKRLFKRSPEPSQISMVQTMRLAPASTSHLRDYLDYYRSRKGPGYAVLITGDWGSGKTFQVREAIPESEAYYVSLFGLATADEVVAAIYTAMFPGKAWIKKLANSIGEVGAEVSNVGSIAVGGLTSGLVNAVLRSEVSSDKPTILDDLERCSLGVKEILGIINRYVEHHKCSVVVIAHDDKLAGEFSDSKEKIFGQTLRVEPQVSPAFDAFHSNVPAGVGKDIILKYKADILGVFSSSDVKSLRILRHVVEDTDRLICTLDDACRAHDGAMSELVRLFSAINIEWRAGRLHAEDLRRRGPKVAGYQFGGAGRKANNEVPPPIVAAKTRYSSVDITSTLIQDEVLCQMMVAGRFDKQLLRSSVMASAHFLKPGTSRPWQVVSNFSRLDDGVVEEAIKRMNHQFDEREILDSGEMLHVFALRMMMSSEGILGKDVNAVAAECKAYVDDLLKSGRLEPRGLDWRWHDDIQDSAHGVMYWVTDRYAAQFSEVLAHLLKNREKALEAKFPEIVPKLLDAMRSNGEKFFEEICHTQAGGSRYAIIPVLAAIAPGDFVRTWMEAPKQHWYWIAGGLRERYKMGFREEALKPEEEWIAKVVDLLKKEVDRASGLAKVRIARAIAQMELSKV